MPKNKVRLQVEPVESRVVLAGSISVNVVGSTMVVLGTSGNDSIRVEQLTRAQANQINHKLHTGAAAGDYLVVSNQPINGRNNVTDVALNKHTNGAIVHGADRMVINGLGGSDHVVIHGRSPRAGGPLQAESVVISGSVGDDHIELNRAQIASNLVLDGVGGNDRLHVNYSKVGGNLVVTGGTGNDNISLTKANVQGRLTVVTSIGQDTMTLKGVTVHDNTFMSLGGSNDSVTFEGGRSSFLGSNFYLNGGTGDNHLVTRTNPRISDPHPTVLNFA